MEVVWLVAASLSVFKIECVCVHGLLPNFYNVMKCLQYSG